VWSLPGGELVATVHLTARLRPSIALLGRDLVIAESNGVVATWGLDAARGEPDRLVTAPRASRRLWMTPVLPERREFDDDRAEQEGESYRREWESYRKSLGAWRRAQRHPLLSRDGTRVIVESGDRYTVWDVATEKEVASTDVFEGGETWGNDEFLFGEWRENKDWTVRWDVLNDEFEYFDEFANRDAEALSLDGAYLAVSDQETGDLRVLNLNWDRVVQSLPGRGFVDAAAFAPDNSRLAVAEGGTIELWDLRSGESLLRLPDGLGVTRLAFSPDGACLVGASQTGMLWIWDGSGDPSFAPIDSRSSAVGFYRNVSAYLESSPGGRGARASRHATVLGVPGAVIAVLALMMTVSVAFIVRAAVYSVSFLVMVWLGWVSGEVVLAWERGAAVTVAILCTAVVTAAMSRGQGGIAWSLLLLLVAGFGFALGLLLLPWSNY
jgi:hypothetical protein